VSVLKYIQDRSNLEPERYKASSFGEFRPIADNSSAEGKRKNRRVEIYVKYKGLIDQADDEEIALSALNGNETPGQNDQAEDIN
jgi:chemotaxis protein MotB